MIRLMVNNNNGKLFTQAEFDSLCIKTNFVTAVQRRRQFYGSFGWLTLHIINTFVCSLNYKWRMCWSPSEMTNR